MVVDISSAVWTFVQVSPANRLTRAADRAGARRDELEEKGIARRLAYRGDGFQRGAIPPGFCSRFPLIGMRRNFRPQLLRNRLVFIMCQIEESTGNDTEKEHGNGRRN